MTWLNFSIKKYKFENADVNMTVLVSSNGFICFECFSFSI